MPLIVINIVIDVHYADHEDRSFTLLIRIVKEEENSCLDTSSSVANRI